MPSPPKSITPRNGKKNLPMGPSVKVCTEDKIPERVRKVPKTAST